jgi:hypothetical protein
MRLSFWNALIIEKIGAQYVTANAFYAPKLAVETMNLVDLKNTLCLSQVVGPSTTCRPGSILTMSRHYKDIILHPTVVATRAAPHAVRTHTIDRDIVVLPSAFRLLPAEEPSRQQNVLQATPSTQGQVTRSAAGQQRATGVRNLPVDAVGWTTDVY